jgi:hypothetical protein
MSARRESTAFALVLGALVALFLGESLFGGKVLSPGDVLFVSASFRDVDGPDHEPANRLLMDPVLQFEPWLEFNRALFRQGRLPLWNDHSGCGAPHLANGQSAPFDPFHLIAYLGRLPDALAWMAAARLWTAGLGMFLLARLWGLAAWGRWFAGLSYPFCGFLIVWLLYPVTNVAVWMPWLFWASEKVLRRPEPRRLGTLALVVGCVFLGGHIQTSAHVLLAGAFVVWRVVAARGSIPMARPVATWAMGVAVGLTIASASIVPLWVYLAKSPVWADRERERPSPLSVTRPRGLDAICTAIPYAFGSQRRGHPNLARAIGVHNLNESAGGFAGLATLIWLAPQGWRARRANGYVSFLAALVAFGFLAAFGFPPVANLLRALPVVNVTDHRRFTLWVAFGLVLLGGVGLDQVSAPWPRRVARYWLLICVAAVSALSIGAVSVARTEPWLRARAEDHYARAAESTDGADIETYRRRADRQVRQTLVQMPRALGLAAAEIAVLAAFAVLGHSGLMPWKGARLGLILLTVGELFAFGFGLNPAIDRRADRPVPAVIALLQREVGASGRVLGVGQELLPNVAMRYELSDPRNYDSVELSRSLDWFAPLYEPSKDARSSRRTVAWAGVVRARGQLREAGVVAVVAASPPPEGLASRVDREGAVWVARLDAEPLVSAGPGIEVSSWVIDQGKIDVILTCSRKGYLIVRQTFDPGWRAEAAGRPVPVESYRGTFLSVLVEPGTDRVSLVYDPPEVRASCAAMLLGLVVAGIACSGFVPRRSPDFGVKGLEGPEPSG